LAIIYAFLILWQTNSLAGMAVFQWFIETTLAGWEGREEGREEHSI
jgi:hypothetical protein